MEIDRDVVDAVRARLGATYDDLVEVLLDVGQPPLFLFGDERPRVIEARSRAVAAIHEWESEDPQEVRSLVERLPVVFQMPDSSQALLESVPATDYFDIPGDLFLAKPPHSAVFERVPRLLEVVDDDGLLPVAGFDARPHGLLVDDLSLHYHQFLRRGFASNIHYELVGTVLQLGARPDVRARLAVDHRRVRRREEHEEFLESDYWYGAPLRAEQLDDLHALGETVYGDLHQGTSPFHPYVALSVRWTRSGTEKTVEIEELVRAVPGRPVMARYLHAIRDTVAGQFIHCDGAVKRYDAASYPDVVGEFAQRGRAPQYRKVFRVDGSLTTEDWSALGTQWFRGNELILEYFSGEGPR